ncbi:vWA domain-containing protein [Pengzhenrongella sicca]|uniref:VWA domain-containing protein n=1 Tax=Pengzhenrongella sicca TaxID=2819238 RepID=A0A8A4ZIU8_9MICO|nr:hypothetical protein [Pengzhenrongella sicca]QTE30899.1 hypothetical protein J4E96_08225 [Pengzhenrongella sicca]
MSARGPARRRGASGAEIDALRLDWAAQWPQALAAWGRFTRLHAPVLHGRGQTPADVGSFAWFSCTDVEVHIDLADIADRGLADHAVAVLAHEIGHHVLSPGDLSTSALLLARARTGLVDLVDAAPLISNLWSDLLINDRLQRRSGIAMDALWRAIGPPQPDDVVMQLVARTYELLWSLPSSTLTQPAAPIPEAEAGLCARLVRAYADDPVGGIGGFAALVRRLAGPLPDPGAPDESAAALADRTDAASSRIGTGRAAVCAQHGEAGGQVVGLSGDPTLATPVLHPALDPRVVGPVPDPGDAEPAADPNAAPPGVGPGSGQALSPAAYHQVLTQLGVSDSLEESARRWYREQAARYLVPFPTRTSPAVLEPLLAAHELWEVSDDLGDIDWTATLLRSPVVVPGVTTVQRGHDDSPGSDPAPEPVDLDLYLDSSGSMPDPRGRVSPIALAGAVLALSALRAGARVQATTWSGPNQIAGTGGFTRDPDAVLTAIVAHFGGGTSFPLPLLAATHPDLPDPRRRPCHIAVISDDGVSSMFGAGQEPGADDVAGRAVRSAAGGGSLILLASAQVVEHIASIAPGYDVYAVVEWEDLMPFAREFVRRTWARSAGARSAGVRSPGMRSPGIQPPGVRR